VSQKNASLATIVTCMHGQRCMETNGQWMASNRLKLNPVKTDLLWCATRWRQRQLNRNSLVFGGATLQPSSRVRDLGVILDSETSFSLYSNQLVSCRCISSDVSTAADDARIIVSANRLEPASSRHQEPSVAGVVQIQTQLQLQSLTLTHTDTMPASLRSSDSLCQFRRQLKTFLFVKE